MEEGIRTYGLRTFRTGDEKYPDPDVTEIVEKLKKLVEPPETDQTCDRCSGTCCKAFQVEVRVTEEGRINWDSHIFCESDRKDADFAKKHWVPIETYGMGGSVEYNENPITGQKIGKFWFTCLKFDWDQGLCTVYDDRPVACRRYICYTAQQDGKTPKEHYSGRELAFVNYPGLLYESNQRPIRLGTDSFRLITEDEARTRRAEWLEKHYGKEASVEKLQALRDS